MQCDRGLDAWRTRAPQAIGQLDEVTHENSGAHRQWEHRERPRGAPPRKKNTTDEQIMVLKQDNVFFSQNFHRFVIQFSLGFHCNFHCGFHP